MERVAESVVHAAEATVLEASGAAAVPGAPLGGNGGVRSRGADGGDDPDERVHEVINYAATAVTHFAEQEKGAGWGNCGDGKELTCQQ
jgi:hypothetical protein